MRMFATGTVNTSLNRTALSATVHCLSGCAIGEVLGMVVGTVLTLGTGTIITISVALAFFFGYLFTALPLLRGGMSPRQAARIALAADTASISLMELIDNTIMVFIPGAMNAGLDRKLFWGSLALSLLLAGVAAYPLNRWMIARGLGHARAHGAMHKHH